MSTGPAGPCRERVVKDERKMPLFSKPAGVTNDAFEEWRVRKYYETNQLALLVLLGNRMFFVIDRILNNGILSFTLYDASSDFPLTPRCSTNKTPPDRTQKYRH